jgi:hypothetical protein
LPSQRKVILEAEGHLPAMLPLLAKGKKICQVAAKALGQLALASVLKKNNFLYLFPTYCSWKKNLNKHLGLKSVKF